MYLPFLEQQTLREIGTQLAEPEKRKALASVMATPLAVFHCPSRRAAQVYSYKGPLPLRNVDVPPAVAKTDYAINGGDQQIDAGPGPDSTSLPDLRRYDWPDIGTFTGIAFVLSAISMAAILDGTSNTCMLGEKQQ